MEAKNKADCNKRKSLFSAVNIGYMFADVTYARTLLNADCFSVKVGSK
jgi:hypothetical protein